MSGSRVDETRPGAFKPWVEWNQLVQGPNRGACLGGAQRLPGAIPPLLDVPNA